MKKFSQDVTKPEESDSDNESGDKGKITLSISHLDSEHFLTTESEEETPVPKPKPPPVRKSKAKRAKTDDCRVGEVLKLTSDNFRIKKWPSARGTMLPQVIF